MVYSVVTRDKSGSHDGSTRNVLGREAIQNSDMKKQLSEAIRFCSIAG